MADVGRPAKKNYLCPKQETTNNLKLDVYDDEF